jgi:ClpP class serine protease
MHRCSQARAESAATAEPMKRFFALSTVFGLMAGLLLLGFSTSSSAEVLKIVVKDTIQPITVEYIGRALDDAARNNDKAVLIELNTPGGFPLGKLSRKYLLRPFRSSFT